MTKFTFHTVKGVMSEKYISMLMYEQMKFNIPFLQKINLEYEDPLFCN